MLILKDKTRSICHICFKEIDAQVVERGSGVYLIKDCPEHGQFEVLIEKDPWVYKRLMNKASYIEKTPFINLALSATHLCDLNCNICYLPKRDDFNLSIDDIKNIVSEFTGRYIWISGGEPLLRDDLPEIIKYIVANRKIPCLLTNGLKLNDINYVTELKKAGLEWIHFSFNGFDDRIYEQINGQRLLNAKLKALNNIKKINIHTVLSVVLTRNLNEKALKEIYWYCLKNNSFIKQLRIRSSVHIGKHTEEENFYLSELIELFGKAIKVSKEELVMHTLSKPERYFVYDYNNTYMPCHLEIDLFILLMDLFKIKENGNSLFKKIKITFKLLPRVGIKNLVKMILLKLAKRKRLIDFSICLRAWPDKYRIDLGEIQRCPSAYVTCNNKRILPFCYALILNEKNNIL